MFSCGFDKNGSKQSLHDFSPKWRFWENMIIMYRSSSAVLTKNSWIHSNPQLPSAEGTFLHTLISFHIHTFTHSRIHEFTQ